ncbi:MAG: acetyl-CoA carboxylase carboxyltransferase subunit beta [Abditibacteriota bacterium]|nr:acetyl-CoA carboxylase carboxyltransferase subunit beta [Abditibacteriota bacterium]
MANWFGSLKSGLRPDKSKQIDSLPDGIWIKCPSCNEILFTKELLKNQKVCPKCSYHFRLSATERIQATFDEGTWQETNTELSSGNPLDFPEYESKLKKGAMKSGLRDSVTTGTGRINGFAVSCAISDFAFMGGSMGSVAGEKIVRCLETAIDKRIPALVFTASGGARMQEGILSLMQMAKTSAAVAEIHRAGLPYVVVMTDPTTAGVHASYASLGDFIFAEPGALIGFAGARVSENTQVMHDKPEDFQTPEFQLRNGMIDGIIQRKELKGVLERVFMFALGEVR